MSPERLSCVFFAAFVAAAPVLTAATAQAATPLPCAATAISAKKLPSGPAQYESGSLGLKNGASMRLQGDAAVMNVAKSMNVGDPVAACYGPMTAYADAGPSRTITVLDLKNGAFYATFVGTWKR